ncbi:MULTISPECIES: PLDc N-terminal domain-containing protein [unclassified Microbacterium]|uniref:PLDc N-terminal domain-containing protein n=1 Tax=unclassified Microbacterium TaxID=2609290 RepID=UPI003016D1C6
MARVLVIGGFLAAVFWVFSIVDCAVQPATRHRGVSKTAWVFIVILLPVIGGILWFAIGRRRANDPGVRPVVAPDDDPAFLRRISKTEQDARIARLEEELARLDEETDEPPSTDQRP